MLYNHNDSQGVLARSKFGKGSLSINITDKGVDFEFKAKQTPLGEEILQAVNAGDLDACSFAFRIAEGGDHWEKRSDKTYLRTINKFESLHDFSIVVQPAYEATTVSARSLDKLKELRANEEKQPESKVNQKKPNNPKFEKYYKNLINKYLKH
jgi:HK97 family phage prohead protease